MIVMFPLRVILLVSTLGLAALIGWLHHSTSTAPVAGVTTAGQIVDGRTIPPPHTSPLKRHSRRGRAAPDPSPDECEPDVILEDADDDSDGDRDNESVRIVPPTAACSGATATDGFATAASTRGAGPNPLFLTFGRFRC
jgi:hypothetical protein